MKIQYILRYRAIVFTRTHPIYISVFLLHLVVKNITLIEFTCAFILQEVT